MPTPTEDDEIDWHEIVRQVDTIRLEDITRIWEHLNHTPSPTVWRMSNRPTRPRYRLVWRDHITNQLDYVGSYTLTEIERKVRECSEQYPDKTFWYEEVRMWT